jgi:hypothetical protein
MVYGCRNAPFKGVLDRITGLSEVNSGSSACGLPGLEAQQPKYETNDLPYRTGASSTLAGRVTTKSRIDVASFDQLQKQIGASLLWRSKCQTA